MNNSLTEIFDNRTIRIAMVGVLGILALYLLAQTIGIAQNFGRSGIPATDTITVQGTGKATLVPDVAKISFTVTHTAPAVADAQTATTKQSNAVVDYLKTQGIADKDVKTDSYSISPQYSYPVPCTTTVCTDVYREPKVTGYTVAQSVTVTMRKLDAVGTLLEGLGKLAVQNLYGPNFALDDSTAGYTAARADAINDAKQQARILAGQLGVHLGKIVNFSESNGGYQYPVAYAMNAMDGDTKAAPPIVPTGENTYNASVSVTYEIR